VRKALASACCFDSCCESAESDPCGAADGARLPNEPKPPEDGGDGDGRDPNDDDEEEDDEDEDGADEDDDLRDEKPLENDFDDPEDDECEDDDECDDEDEGRAAASCSGCAISVSTHTTRSSIVRDFDMARSFLKKLK
jgi:hypothetical protein